MQYVTIRRNMWGRPVVPLRRKRRWSGVIMWHYVTLPWTLNFSDWIQYTQSPPSTIQFSLENIHFEWHKRGCLHWQFTFSPDKRVLLAQSSAFYHDCNIRGLQKCCLDLTYWLRGKVKERPDDDPAPVDCQWGCSKEKVKISSLPSVAVLKWHVLDIL